MEAELRPFVRRAHLRVDPRSSRSVAGPGAPRLWRGRVGATEIVATRIGVGRVPAAEMTEMVLDTVEVDHVVIMGVAGGLAPAASVGEVVVPAVVVDGETGLEYRSPSSVVAGAAGTILTTATPVTDAVAHLDWAAQGYRAVDLESAVVAMACAQRGIPWTTVRGISDRPDHGIVDQHVMALTRADGTADLLAVCRFLLRRPQRLPDLVTLGRGLRSATGAAADAVLGACAGEPPS